MMMETSSALQGWNLHSLFPPKFRIFTTFASNTKYQTKITHKNFNDSEYL